MSVGNYAAWAAEYTPPTLRAVAQAVVDRFASITWSHIGIKGNDAHRGGYHRSLRWCRVTRGVGVDYSDRIGRDTSQAGTRRKDALRALDITAPADILIPMCSRLDWAMRHGLIDDVREWYGNDDGDQRVDGYDNFFNVVVSSDDSHLWHLHGSLYTDTVDGPHTRLIAVLLGTPGWNTLEDDMLTAQEKADWQYMIWRLEALAYMLPTYRGGPEKGKPVPFVAAMKALSTAVGQVDEAVGAQLADEFARIEAASKEGLAAIEVHEAQTAGTLAELHAQIEQLDNGGATAAEVVEQMRATLHAATAPPAQG